MDVTKVAACVGDLNMIFPSLVPVYTLSCQVVRSLRQLLEIVLVPHTYSALEAKRTAQLPFKPRLTRYLHGISLKMIHCRILWQVLAKVRIV